MLNLQLMRILAVIPLYHPDTELLRKNLDAFAPWVESILLWQNSPVDASCLEDCPWSAKIRFCGQGSNDGISKALNFAWKTAADEGFDAVLTMDQDSVWKNFPEFVRKVSGNSAPYGFYGPGVNGKAFEGDFIESTDLITSGMLIPMRVLDAVGGWEERFKVDGIDNDFVFHALSLGIKGWKTGGCALIQEFGRVTFRRFLGIRYRVYNYPPERLYEIYRNNLAVIHRYPDTGEFARRFRKNWFLRKPIRILLGEKDVSAKFKAIFAGIRDARRYANA